MKQFCWPPYHTIGLVPGHAHSVMLISANCTRVFNGVGHGWLASECVCRCHTPCSLISSDYQYLHASPHAQYRFLYLPLRSTEALRWSSPAPSAGEWYRADWNSGRVVPMTPVTFVISVAMETASSYKFIGTTDRMPATCINEPALRCQSFLLGCLPHESERLICKLASRSPSLCTPGPALAWASSLGAELNDRIAFEAS